MACGTNSVLLTAVGVMGLGEGALSRSEDAKLEPAGPGSGRRVGGQRVKEGPPSLPREVLKVTSPCTAMQDVCWARALCAWNPTCAPLLKPWELHPPG